MTRTSRFAIALLALGLPFAAVAHKAWLLPSQTVLSGNEPWITVDGAVSNDLFYFNHVPLRLQGLSITAPDGNAVEAQNPATGKYRSVFDVQLTQTGTYRIAVVNDGIIASWKENGESKRWRGTAADLPGKVPVNAVEPRITQGITRVETFVTNGNPDTNALTTTGSGLEMQPVTHPNDLFAGEEGRFRLLVDGQPQADINVEVVRGGTRYRNAQGEVTVKTDANGEFAVTWSEPGMYWIEASVRDEKSTVPQASERRLTYVATLEVLPQ